MFNHRNKILIVCGACLAFWTLLTLAMAGYFYLAIGFSWEQALRISIRDWAPWALLSPLVVWLTRRLPFERKMLPLSVPGHLAGCALAVAACGWIADWMLPPTPWRNDWQQRRQQFSGGTNAPSFFAEGWPEPRSDRPRAGSPDRRGRRP
ncbi:MAG: hypothetical protein NTY01_23285, partial [Verrucomicrobia bacterium]|nr:hypothetical protein [Verrucomicrobiota bacterium]